MNLRLTLYPPLTFHLHFYTPESKDSFKKSLFYVTYLKKRINRRNNPKPNDI